MEKKLTTKVDQKRPYEDLIQARKKSKQKANTKTEKQLNDEILLSIPNNIICQYCPSIINLRNIKS